MLPIVKGILRGDNKSISKAISIIDNDEHDSTIIIREKQGEQELSVLRELVARERVRSLASWQVNFKNVV
jgi:hypothetical protein